MLFVFVGEPYHPPAHVYYFPFVSSVDGKGGLAWAHRGRNDVTELGVSFFQDWLVGGESVQGLTHVPHLACRYWPYDSDETTAVTDYLADLRAIQPHDDTMSFSDDTMSSYSDTMLFLNEPDLEGQCTITPQEAVTIIQEALFICPDCKFTLPQVSHLDYLSGWPWIREFISEYQQQTAVLPPVTYGSFHLYDMAVTAALDSYEAMLLEAGYPAVLPLLITETGACSSQMATQMLDELESDNRVEQYFWYAPFDPDMCTNLFVGFDTTDLTLVGQAFKER